MSDLIFSPQELAEIRAYHDPSYLAGAVHEFLLVGYWVVCLAFLVERFHAWSVAWSVRLAPRSSSKLLDLFWGGDGWRAALLFTLAIFATCDLLWVPANFYFGFVREHAFGLSNQSLARFTWDWVKTLVFGGVTLAILAFGMFGLARRLRWWWLIMGCVAGALLNVSAAIDPYRAQVYVDQDPLPAGEVRDAITALMRKANIDFRDVVLEKTLSQSVRVQAYFAGKGPTRTIVVNDALLKNLSTDEVVAAVGHEAGHVRESRWVGQVSSAVALLLFLLATEVMFRLAARRQWWGVTERADLRVLPLIFAVFGVCHLLVVPFSAASQRQREYDADRYGLELTGNPDAFRRMLIKAAKVNKMDPDPPRWVVLKSWSHPPIRERLEALDQWKKADGG